MSSQFVTPSSECPVQIKQEPVEDDYRGVAGLALGPPATIQSPSGHIGAGVFKYGRLDSTRNRAYEKPHNCCEVCQGEFSDQDLLLQHKLLHFNTSHVCYICDCYFMNTSTLIMHIATNHRNLNPALSGRNDPDRSFLCSICLQRFSSNKTLSRHQESHKQQDETTFSCRICGLEFIGYRALVPHLNAARHKEMKIKIQGIFVCVDCRSVFPSRDSYAMHMMMRAQSETCSARFLVPATSGYDSRGSYDYSPTTAPAANGPIQNGGGGGGSIQNSTRSDSAPLNLCTGQERISPSAGVGASKYQILTCCRCGEVMPDEEALALHLMVHVRETSDKPYYGRYQSRAPPSDQRAVGSQYNKRPDSAPASDNVPRIQTTGGGAGGGAGAEAVWTCHWCDRNFKSCNVLAVHMMEQHVQSSSKAADKANNNRKSFSDINDAVDDVSDKEMARGDEPDHVIDPMCIVVTADYDSDDPNAGRRLKAGQTSFSERSSPVCRKRPAAAADDDDRADLTDADVDGAATQRKRCKSVGSSLIECFYCGRQFISERARSWHAVDEHGCSPTGPQCLICNRPFLERHALREHLRSADHLKAAARRDKAPCRVCKFVADGDAQLAAHERLHGIRRRLHLGAAASDPKSADPEPGAELGDGAVTPTAEQNPEDVDTTTTTTTTTTNTAATVTTTEASAVQRTTTPTRTPTGDLPPDKEPTDREPSGVLDTPNKNAAVVHDSTGGSSRRSKRKSKVTAKFTPEAHSPSRSISENDAWADATGGSSPTACAVVQGRPSSLDQPIISLPVESSFNSLVSTSGSHSAWQRLDGGAAKAKCRSGTSGYQQPSTPAASCETLPPAASGNSDESNVDLIDYVLSNTDKLCMCKYCKIIYTDQTMYYLHMGLHNLNNPWQCNLCGKVSRNVHDFTCHVIHY